MTYLLALDQGTSSSRSIVFDERGHIVAQAQLELPQIYPQPGWVEHDPLEIWRTQLATARDALVHTVAVADKAPVTCKDPDDQRFIDLAVAHQCTVLSKDHAVLCMAKRLLALGAHARVAI